MIRAVLVDVGNTLYIYDSRIKFRLNKLKSFFNMDIDELFNYFCIMKKRHMIKEPTSMFKEEQRIISIMIKEKSLINENKILEIDRLAEQEYWEKPILFEDAIPFLQNLKKLNLNIYALTTISKPFLQKMRVYDFFDNCFVSRDYKIKKVTTELYEIALKEINLKPNQVVMVGDNLEADINPPKKLGINTIWLNRKNIVNRTNIKPDLEVNNLIQALEWIKSNVD